MANEFQPSPFRDKIPLDFLILFAVKEEAAYFELPPTRRDCATGGQWSLVTGMGRTNSARATHAALDRFSPRVVLTCGFAGGLNPALPLGSIVFDESTGTGVGEALLEMGAVPARFHCAKRVAITKEEKYDLWMSTGADVVEMESSVIRNICQQRHVASATVRVISDTAHDDLPLDFNALMTSADRINYPKLIGTLLIHPNRIPRLLAFQRQTMIAAKELGAALRELMSRQRHL